MVWCFTFDFLSEIFPESFFGFFELWIFFYIYALLSLLLLFHKHTLNFAEGTGSYILIEDQIMHTGLFERLNSMQILAYVIDFVCGSHEQVIFLFFILIQLQLQLILVSLKFLLRFVAFFAVLSQLYDCTFYHEVVSYVCHDNRKEEHSDKHIDHYHEWTLRNSNGTC